MKNFKNKLAVITGGSSGIGLALAKQLAAQGMNVWILARREEVLINAIEEIRREKVSEDQKFGYQVLDVADAIAVQKEMGVFQNEVGVPDLLVNSAGVTFPGEFEKIEIPVFHNMMDVNYFGTVHMVHALVDGMAARGSGHIVNVSSVAGFLAIYGYTAYSGAKFAVRGFSDALRSELKLKGLQVSVAFPPDTDTPMLAYENEFKPPITREVAGTAGLMAPEDVARSILKGIEKNKYLIITGFESKLLFSLNNLLGSLVYPILDIMIAQAKKKIEKSPKVYE